MAGRKPILVEHQGKTYTLKQLSIDFGVPYSQLWYRHRAGKTGDELVSPVPLPSGRAARRMPRIAERAKGLM